MLEFLKKCNVSNNIIEEIEVSNDKSYLFDLNCNRKECIKIIDYLKEIGISVVDEILINETDIFFKTKEEIKEALSNFEIPQYVKEINNNYNEIEKLYDYL